MSEIRNQRSVDCFREQRSDYAPKEGAPSDCESEIRGQILEVRDQMSEGETAVERTTE